MRIWQPHYKSMIYFVSFHALINFQHRNSLKTIYGNMITFGTTTTRNKKKGGELNFSDYWMWFWWTSIEQEFVIVFPNHMVHNKEIPRTKLSWISCSQLGNRLFCLSDMIPDPFKFDLWMLWLLQISHIMRKSENQRPDLILHSEGLHFARHLPHCPYFQCTSTSDDATSSSTSSQASFSPEESHIIFVFCFLSKCICPQPSYSHASLN